MLSTEQASDFLAKLYRSPFNGKPSGRYRIARGDLAKLIKRENIEQLTINEIGLWLSEKHGLHLIDMYDEFAIIKFSIFRRYRKASVGVFENVLDLSFDFDESYDDE